MATSPPPSISGYIEPCTASDSTRGELASLFVVGSDRVARLRWVKIGRTLEQGVEVLSGVDAGERVIVDGSKGRDGALVQDMTAVALPPQAP